MGELQRLEKPIADSSSQSRAALSSQSRRAEVPPGTPFEAVTDQVEAVRQRPDVGPTRLLAYLWAGPNSLVGLALGVLGLVGGGRLRRLGGVVEAEGPFLAWLLSRAILPAGGAEALTLGHVVVGRDPACLDRCRRHERVHVRQYEAWGPFFLPAYLLSSLTQWVAGRDPYRDNHFEREAFARAPVDD